MYYFVSKILSGATCRLRTVCAFAPVNINAAVSAFELVSQQITYIHTMKREKNKYFACVLRKTITEANF